MVKQGRDYWLQQEWGKLRLDPSQELPETWSHGSSGRFQFRCECGNFTSPLFFQVHKGNSRSCGRCGYLSKAHWIQQRWGELVLDPDEILPEEWGEMSNRRMTFLCDCGNSTLMKFSTVTTGNSKSCGKCLWKPKNFWLIQKWGSLKLDSKKSLPNAWSCWLPSSLTFLCDCGRSSDIPFKNVTSGNSTSCGSCLFHSKTYWLSQSWGNLTISAHQTLPKEWGEGSVHKVNFNCSCGETTCVPFRWVAGGNTKSCGCIKPGNSKFSPAYAIYAMVKALCPDAEFSYWFRTPAVKRMEYDIYVPSLSIAVELHGLIWHSEKYNTTQRDQGKYLVAQARGDRLIQIYSDEWRDKQTIMKAMLKSLIQPKAGKRIKPTFEVHHGTPSEARDFLDTHHYLGAASQTKGKGVTVIARHGGAVVGVWVFMKREEGVVLWHRASWNHEYRAWNPHEKALALALPELRSIGFKRIVTFSDNRFHTGKLYEKLGFKFETAIPPDYGYTNGVVRKSKYALRVKAGINEVEAAKEKGWYRIWDSGKRRFSLTL